MKILECQEAVTKTTRVEGQPDKVDVVGMTYRGYVGELPIGVTVLNNGTMSIRVAGSVVGLNSAIVEDLKEILVPNQVSLAS